MVCERGAAHLDVDSELTLRAINGDREAFTQLLRRHDPTMRSVAWRMVGRYNLVDDALQDAYVKAYSSIGTFRGEGVFPAWLRRIVANTCIDHVRRYERRREDVLEPNVMDEPQLGTAERIGDADQLQRALRSLPNDQRIALVLVEVEGYSYSEAASLTNTSTSNLGSRLSRARASLRTILDNS